MLQTRFIQVSTMMVLRSRQVCMKSKFFLKTGVSSFHTACVYRCSFWITLPCSKTCDKNSRYCTCKYCFFNMQLPGKKRSVVFVLERDICVAESKEGVAKHIAVACCQNKCYLKPGKPLCNAPSGGRFVPLKK